MRQIIVELSTESPKRHMWNENRTRRLPVDRHLQAISLHVHIKDMKTM